MKYILPSLIADLVKVVLFCFAYRLTHWLLFGPTPTWEVMLIGTLAGIAFIKPEYTHTQKSKED